MVEKIIVVDDQGHRSDVWSDAKLWADLTRVLREDCVFGMGEPRDASRLLYLCILGFPSIW